ncbi:hypothetical protein P0Y35_08395 [Kiritimatiellaeota bacterium B1221]|nr:hypothetical protein [Kiritimatiellaeota bacterium B1221]
MKQHKDVTYEDFGAVGNGVHDDLPAICAAHAHANAEGLPVKTKGDAIYHLGRQALTAVIQTDTDWNTSRFTIDDREVEDPTQMLFCVCSALAPVDLGLKRLSRDQADLDLKPECDCHVWVENNGYKKYIRRGLNQHEGYVQQDSFILRRNGEIEGPIDWDYDELTQVEACPIDESVLRVSGGIFTTFANRMQREGYFYWGRGIEITRSNTEVEGLTHYVVGETNVGQPYRGFLDMKKCANLTLRNCFVSGHKMYETIGSAGKPVNMGSYDLHANHVVNLRLIDCRMHHILDRSLWGVISTNFCKNILMEDCTLSRMDTHMGVSGGYTIRGCTLGHMGLNAIGRGKLLLEGSSIYGYSLINFRGDYGSIWDGDVEVRNCQWFPGYEEKVAPLMFNVINDGMHDFGYACSMPRKIQVEGLRVDDRNHPEGYAGLLVFPDQDRGAEGPLPETRPYPYAQTQSVHLKGVVTLSGKEIRLSTNPELQKNVSFHQQA